MSRRRRRSGLRKVSLRLLQGHDFRVLGLQIEQIGLVRRRMPISYRVADDERNETVLARIDRGSADTATGRQPGDQNRIDA